MKKPDIKDYKSTPAGKHKYRLAWAKWHYHTRVKNGKRSPVAKIRYHDSKILVLTFD